MKIKNIQFLSDSQKEILLNAHAKNPMFGLVAKGMISSKVVIEMLEKLLTTGFAKTGYYNGSGRYTSAQSFTSIVSEYLNLLEIKFEKGNDAPRGGVAGEFIKINNA